MISIGFIISSFCFFIVISRCDKLIITKAVQNRISYIYNIQRRSPFNQANGKKPTHFHISPRTTPIVAAPHHRQTSRRRGQTRTVRHRVQNSPQTQTIKASPLTNQTLILAIIKTLKATRKGSIKCQNHAQKLPALTQKSTKKGPQIYIHP